MLESGSKISPVPRVKGISKWEILFARKLELDVVEAFKFFRAIDIEPLLIKGWAAARNYPDDNPRSYTDVDLSVPAELFGRAQAAIAEAKGRTIEVDLHREFKQLDTKPWHSVFADSETAEIDGYPIRVPCAEDHLRILAVHWLNDGGEHEHRLWDIYYAVANRPADFDWEKCLGVVSENRRFWVIAAIGIANRYLSLPLDGLPFKDEAERIPNWVLSTIEFEWRSGVRHRSLHTCLRDPKEFVRQLRKRFPPNPIQATIESEGDLRSRSRLSYQLGSMRRRFLPSVKGVSKVLLSR